MASVVLLLCAASLSALGDAVLGTFDTTTIAIYGAQGNTNPTIPNIQ
jgi:hypothetical protein